eukprot:345540-Hanusia_phi.AAC.1
MSCDTLNIDGLCLESKHGTYKPNPCSGQANDHHARPCVPEPRAARGDDLTGGDAPRTQAVLLHHRTAHDVPARAGDAQHQLHGAHGGRGGRGPD